MKNETKKIIVTLNVVAYVTYYILSIYLTRQNHNDKFLLMAEFMAIHATVLILSMIFNLLKKNNEIAKLLNIILLALLLLGFPFCVAPIFIKT